MLRKYTLDLTHVVDWGELVVDADGTFEEGPVCIMDSQEQVLRGKTVRLVKVLWQHRGIEVATWEHEDEGMFFCHLILNECSICCDCMCCVCEFQGRNSFKGGGGGGGGGVEM